MEINSIKQKIKKDPVHPIYFLYGEESFYIDDLSKFIVETTVSPETRDFNYSIYYGREVNSPTLLDALMRYPMMAAYQVIHLKEAQQMKDFSELIPYFKSPAETTIFIIEYKGSVDKRYKVFKTLGALKTSYEFKPVRDYQIVQWISDYVAGQNWSIEPESTRLLGEYLGTDLQKIVNELDKIMLNKKGDNSITRNDIERYVGISKEYNVFELQRAIGSGQKSRAIHIVTMMMQNEKDNSPVMIISMLYAYFTKIYKMHFLKSAPQSEQLKQLGLSHSFFLQEFLQATRQFNVPKCEMTLAILHEYDLKSKGFDFPAGDGGGLIQEMLYRILS